MRYCLGHLANKGWSYKSKKTGNCAVLLDFKGRALPIPATTVTTILPPGWTDTDFAFCRKPPYWASKMNYEKNDRPLSHHHLMPNGYFLGSPVFPLVLRKNTISRRTEMPNKNLPVIWLVAGAAFRLLRWL